MREVPRIVCEYSVCTNEWPTLHFPFSIYSIATRTVTVSVVGVSMSVRVVCHAVRYDEDEMRKKKNII